MTRPSAWIASWATALALALAAIGWAGEIEELRAAAERGNPEAQFRLGDACDNGSGVRQDAAEATKWYRKAAENGHPAGQFALGVIYSTGAGAPRDPVRGLMWLDLAIERGKDVTEIRDQLAAKLTPAQVAEAQRLAREMVARKKKDWSRYDAQQGAARKAMAGGPADVLALYRQQAEAGDPDAQFYLGAAYGAGNGKDLPRDPVECLFWLKLASRSGGRYAQAYREASAQFSPADVAEAERRARAWKPKRLPE